MTPLDERLHRATWKTVLDAALTPHEAYGYDDVPGMRSTAGAINAGAIPDIYVLLSVQRRFADVNIRAGAARGVNAVRLSTRVVGRTEDEAAWARLKVAGVIEEQIVAFDNVDSTPVWFENEDPIVFDEGRYSGLTRWTYQV